MKPTVYCHWHETNPILDLLRNKKIEFNEITNKDIPILNIKELVTKIRESGFPGTYQELSRLPIMEYNGKTYPAKVLKNKEKLLKILRTPEKYTPPQTTIMHEYPIISLEEDTAKQVEDTMNLLTTPGSHSHVIETILNMLTEHEKWAFLVGYRLSAHSTAQKIMKIETRLHTLAREIDPHIKE